MLFSSSEAQKPDFGCRVHNFTSLDLKIYICHKYQKHESWKSNIKMRDDTVICCSTGKLLSFPERWQHFSGGWLLYYFCIHCPSQMHAGSFSFLKSSSKIKFQNAPFTIGRGYMWFLWIPHLYLLSNFIEYSEMWDKKDTHLPPQAVFIDLYSISTYFVFQCVQNMPSNRNPTKYISITSFLYSRFSKIPLKYTYSSALSIPERGKKESNI